MTRDAQYYVPMNIKVLLMTLLLLLNIVIRIPSILHEKGYDSFYIHSLANSISIFGESQWWINWLSVFGLYPYSYASAVPFTLSGMSQLTGIEMEKTILLYCVIIGLFSIFTSYLLAGMLYNNFTFKYILALLFSIAPGVMVFTTWEVSTRGQFIIFFPFFIYLLLKHNAFVKKYLLLFICFVLLFATHHYAYFLIPVSVVYVVFILLQKIKYPAFKDLYITYIFSFGLLSLFLIPFFTRSLIESGSRYDWIITALITNTRYSGPMILFLFGGLTYLLLNKKGFKEIFILSMIALFIPTFYSHTYGPFLILLFIIVLICIAFNNVIHTLGMHKNKLLTLYVVFIIFSFVAFSGYYNHFRTGKSEQYWQMKHETYITGSWGKEYISDNLRGLDSGFETGRIFAISEGHPITPTHSAGNLAYGFISENTIEYVKNPVTSTTYYFEGPYSTKGGTTAAGRIEWIRMFGKEEDLKNYDYFIQDKYQPKPILKLVQLDSNQIYDSPRFAVWKI